jgi:hypothetical protein
MKVLYHFPIILKFQRLFKTPIMSELMLWHSQNSSLDSLMRHPCDSKAWKHIHKKFLNCVANPRNVHLAFIADGVNPCKLTQSTWCTWPVMLLNYNVPPWLTSKIFSSCSHYWFQGRNLSHQSNLMFIYNHYLRSYNNFGLEF